MSENTEVAIVPGDLVQWEAGRKSRVGVVKSVNPDGTSTLSVQRGKDSAEERIKTSRLVRITSTVRPESGAE